jgi:hypothetical protein
MPSESNLALVTKAPDVDGIITLDYITDGIANGQGGCRNVDLTVDGTELKGIAFTENGQPTAYGAQWEGLIMALHTPELADTCTVRHMSAGVADEAKMFVTGSVLGADGILTRADHITKWSYVAEVGHYAVTINLWAPAP